MGNKILYIVAVLVLSLPFPSRSSSKNELSGRLSDEAVQFIREGIRQDRAMDFKLAPFKSKSELERYIATKPLDSPLNVLSVAAARRFINGFEFNEKGVTTFSYRELSGLTASQVYSILAMVGIQSATQSVPGLLIENDTDRAIMAPRNITPQMKADYGDYRCEARATCTQSLTKICTGNC